MVNVIYHNCVYPAGSVKWVTFNIMIIDSTEPTLYHNNNIVILYHSYAINMVSTPLSITLYIL